MHLKEISLVNVRKLDFFKAHFSPTTTIITGNNGQGKTSVLESIFFLLTSKSFRKKYNKSIIKKNQSRLQIKGILKTEEDVVIKICYDSAKKEIEKNGEKVKKTSEILKYSNIVSISPEEPDVIEIYRKEKLQYFDKIIFKIFPNHVETIKAYNKLLLIRNSLLENKQETFQWDKKIIKAGYLIWEEREKFFKYFIEKLKFIEKKIIGKNIHSLKYLKNVPKNEKEYFNKLQLESYNKTHTGPHLDNIYFYLNEKNLQESGSQGEKKLFKYILKLTEAEIINEKKKTSPILLLDDYFAKLDDENIMKIFTFFHRKFQTIITTTKTNNTMMEKRLKNPNTTIKIIKLND
ncbi:MAG: hypothetical protein CMG76_01210 [Candidatus Marinimicrobia bacterium]|nr:hypothetical protein [Candidatus Neomarinimicrobiota bacterium]|tara:strand:- start:6841 stop:7884 length:1044 start_codon:yes stop_codon:yes gene_type:complete